MYKNHKTDFYNTGKKQTIDEAIFGFKYDLTKWQFRLFLKKELKLSKKQYERYNYDKNFLYLHYQK